MTVYSYTGATQTHVVSAGVTFVRIIATGAAGGGNGGTSNPGLGGTAEAIYPVTPGESLSVEVGGVGDDVNVGTGDGGYNGGGDGAGIINNGGGGGASDVRQGGTAITDRLIVGGGGGAAGFSTGRHGGHAGWPDGATDGGSGVGTQTAGGAGGGLTDVGYPGGLGYGGEGGGGGSRGGGGGAGYYGAGGGGGKSGFGSYLGGASGGSSYVGTGDTVDDVLGVAPFARTPELQGANTGNGSVEIIELTGARDTAAASGGTETTVGRYICHEFTADGTLTIDAAGLGEVLLLGGGGSSGVSVSATSRNGGGGAGGITIVPVELTGATMAVVVGVGGSSVAATSADSGGASTFGGHTGKGGGSEGLDASNIAETDIGCGAGYVGRDIFGDHDPFQGYPASSGNGGITNYSGGGGGGGIGGTGADSPGNYYAGDGGDGRAISGWAASDYQVGGGAGGSNAYSDASDGLYQTGYGGGGGVAILGNLAGVDGTDGLVVVRYLAPFTAIDFGGISVDPALNVPATIAEPKTQVSASIVVDPVLELDAIVKVSRRQAPRRTYIWVRGLDGNKSGVIR